MTGVGRKLFIGIFGTIGMAMIGSGIYMTRLPEENEWKEKGGPMIAVGSLFVFLSIIMWLNPRIMTHQVPVMLPMGYPVGYPAVGYPGVAYPTVGYPAVAYTELPR